ncbi:MAG: hypothetical protein AB7T38_07975 [Nitrospirales bacterium]
MRIPLSKLNSSQFHGIMVSLAFLVPIITSCSDITPYVKASSAYSKATEKSIEPLTNEFSQREKVKRQLALAFFVENGDILSNITKEAIKASFINFACTGVGDFAKTKAGLEYLQLNSKGLEEIAKTPDAKQGLIEKIKLIKKLKAHEYKQPDDILNEDNPNTKMRNQCVNELVSLLDPQKKLGEPAINLPDEVAFLAGAAIFQAIYEGTKAILDGVAKEAEERARIKLFKEYVQKYKPAISGYFDEYLVEETFNRLRHDKKKGTIFGPYYRFGLIMSDYKMADDLLCPPESLPQGESANDCAKRKKEEKQTLRIKTSLELLQVGNELEAFDKIRNTPSPIPLIKGLKESFENIVEMSEKDSDITFSKIVKALEAFLGLAENIKKSYDKVEKGLTELSPPEIQAAP